MSDHDEFCPWRTEDGPCICTRLAKARADERERMATAQEAHAEELMGNDHISWHGTAMFLARNLPQIARNMGSNE